MGTVRRVSKLHFFLFPRQSLLRPLDALITLLNSIPNTLLIQDNSRSVFAVILIIVYGAIAWPHVKVKCSMEKRTSIFAKKVSISTWGPTVVYTWDDTRRSCFYCVPRHLHVENENDSPSPNECPPCITVLFFLYFSRCSTLPVQVSSIMNKMMLDSNYSFLMSAALIHKSLFFTYICNLVDK